MLLKAGRYKPLLNYDQGVQRIQAIPSEVWFAGLYKAIERQVDCVMFLRCDST